MCAMGATLAVEKLVAATAQYVHDFHVQTARSRNVHSAPKAAQYRLNQVSDDVSQVFEMNLVCNLSRPGGWTTDGELGRAAVCASERINAGGAISDGRALMAS